MTYSTPDNYLECGLKRVIHQLHNANLEQGVSTNQIDYFHDILCTISSLDGEFKKLERFLLFCKYNRMQPCHRNHAVKYSTCDVDSLNDIANVLLRLLRNMKTETISHSKINHGQIYPKSTHPVNTLLGLENKLFGLLKIIENVKTNIIRQYPHLGLSGIHYNNGVGITPLHHRNISYTNNEIKCNKFGSNAFLMNRILCNNNVWGENFNSKSCKQRNKRLKHAKSFSGDEINKIKPIKYNRYEAKKSLQLFGSDKPKRLTPERKKMGKSHDISNYFSNVINRSVHKHTSESFHKLPLERVHHAKNKTIKANDVNNTTNNITLVYKTRKRAGKDSSSRTRYYADHLYMARVRRGDDDRNQVRRSNRNNKNKQQISKPPLSEYGHTTSNGTAEALEGTRGSFERRTYNSKRIQNSDNENSKNNFDRFIYYFPIEDRATIEDDIPNHTRKFRNTPSNKFYYTARKSIEAVRSNYSVIAGKSNEKASITNKRKKKYNIARVCSPRKYIAQECEPRLSRSSYNHGHLKNKTPYSLLKQKYHFEKWQCRPKCIESRCGNIVQKYFENIPSNYTRNREDNYFDHHVFNCHSPSHKVGCARFKENTCFNIGQGRHVYPHIYDGTMLFPHSNGYSQCNKSLADMGSKYRLTSTNKQEFIVVKQRPSQKRPQPCVIRHYGCKDSGEAYLDVGKKFVKNRHIARNIKKLSTFQPFVIDHETSSSTYSSSENESQDEERHAYRYTNSSKRRRLRKWSILSKNKQSYDIVYYKEAPRTKQKSYHRKYRKSTVKSRELFYPYMLSSSEESIYERPDMKAKRTSTSELITNMKTIATNTQIANGPHLFSRRTSTSGLLRPTTVKETNTVVIRTKESGLDPILVEKVHKFTKTDNPSVRSFGTDAAPEKAKARMINTATDPLYYLSQKSQHTNTVQQKYKDMQDTGTDPNPVPKIDQISVGNDPLYYLSQKVTETNTLPFFTATIGTETLPTPKQISKGTDPKRLETKEDYTSYEKVRTFNKAIGTVQTKQFHKGQQHDTVVKKPKLVSVYTNTDNKITIGNFTQTSFREDIPQKTKMFNVKTQTSYESLVQKGFPILRPPRQAKIVSNVADDNTPSTIQITDPPVKLASNLSVHLFIERVKEEIYRRRSQIGKSVCFKSKNNKPIIFCEKKKSNSIIITNYDSNKEVNVDTFSKIIDATMSNDKTQLDDRSDNDEFTNIIIDNNSNVKFTGKTRLSKGCGMNVHIHRSLQNIHLPSNDKYNNWTYHGRGREEAADHYNVTNITNWKGIANTIKKSTQT